MIKTINILLIIALFFIASISLAQESSSNNFKFEVNTKTYTEPYSHSLITIPEDWTINEKKEASKPNESNPVTFIAPNKKISVSFFVCDLYYELNFIQKLFISRSNNSINEDTYNGIKKELGAGGKSKVAEITLDGEKYIRTISNEKQTLNDENNSGFHKEGYKITIIKIKNLYYYQFDAITDINSDEYKDFEKIVANTVFPKIAK